MLTKRDSLVERTIIGTGALVLVLVMPVALMFVCVASWIHELFDKAQGRN